MGSGFKTLRGTHLSELYGSNSPPPGDIIQHRWAKSPQRLIKLICTFISCHGVCSNVWALSWCHKFTICKILKRLTRELFGLSHRQTQLRQEINKLLLVSIYMPKKFWREGEGITFSRPFQSRRVFICYCNPNKKLIRKLENARWNLKSREPRIDGKQLRLKHDNTILLAKPQETTIFPQLQLISQFDWLICHCR